ncbi:MAG TPA: ABC transporter ATP-binding protein [Candidatus Thermoplasmatota archaeon]|nr:ABC transporter ATP-binding protein [Candidatus Thermoplasmatota archaeon]
MAPGAPDPLEVRDLVKHYGSKVAVDGVSFTVPRGKVFCLLGQNGAGKTTTLEVTQGIRKPTRGEVRLFGEDPRTAGAALKRRMGVLPQRFTGFSMLTVEENLRYFAEIYGADPDLPALLESLDLTASRKAPFSTLSGGTMRRVGIATALVHDPELVFLDEPTAGVDPVNRRRLWDIILRLRKEGRSVVLTTHYMDEAERLADEVAIIHRGRIIARGPPDRVRRDHGGGPVLRISGLQGNLPVTLAGRAGLRQDEEGATLIPLLNASEGPVLLSELARSGVAYQEFTVREPSLDDAFVRLVATTEAA